MKKMPPFEPDPEYRISAEEREAVQTRIARVSGP